MATMLTGVLEDAAGARPDHPALVSDAGVLTYGELSARSHRFASALRSRGIREGERVVILMENRPDVAVALFGTWIAGAVSVALHAQTRVEKLAWILRDSGAAVLVSEAELARTYVPALAGSSVRVVLQADGEPTAGIAPVSESLDAAVADADAVAVHPSRTPLDLAAILYTSGTTGDPKGVMHTHRSLGFTRDAVCTYLGLRDSDRMLCALPLSFGYGLFQLLPAVAVGATVVLERGFAFPAQVFARMRDEAVTTVAGVPTMFAMMLAHEAKAPIRFPSVRIVTNAAAALPEEFLPGMQRLFPNAGIVKMYGQTECIRACYLPPAMALSHAGAVGIAIPGTSLLLLDDGGREVATGETGTLHVHGPNVMLGYWNDPERTAQALVPAPTAGEVMLCTGDQFRRDAEGLLHFVARSDDIIKSRGEKVSPTEVENAIYRLPGVAEVLVIGIPDPVLGQAVCALVVPREDGAVLERDVKRACVERLEGHMVPRRVVFVPSLPRTPNGKLSRKQAAEHYRALLAVPR